MIRKIHEPKAKIIMVIPIQNRNLKQLSDTEKKKELKWMGKEMEIKLEPIKLFGFLKQGWMENYQPR